MLEKIYNMNVKMNERLLMQAYDRYKMFMRANIDIIKAQFREWQKRQTLLWKAKELQQNNARELGLLLAIEAQRKEKEEKATGR
jgi:Fe-S cluster biosynthesis and repair protein YggX